MEKRSLASLPVIKFITLLLIAATSLGCVDAAAQTGDTVTIQQMLDAHNVFRKEVGVPPLTWSDELAKYAQAWVNELVNNRECSMQHRPHDENSKWNLKYGENIYSGGGTNWVPTVLDAVGAWGSEKKNFDFTNKVCKSNGICGHYTQIIWKTTTQVGCATVKCPDGNVIIVCNYSPSGNWMGEKAF